MSFDPHLPLVPGAAAAVPGNLSPLWSRSAFENPPTDNLYGLGPRDAPGVEVAVEAEPLRDEPDAYGRALMREDRRRKRRGVFAWGRANRALLPLLRLGHQVAEDMRERLIHNGARYGLSQKQVALLLRIKQHLASEEGR